MSYALRSKAGTGAQGMCAVLHGCCSWLPEGRRSCGDGANAGRSLARRHPRKGGAGVEGVLESPTTASCKANPVLSAAASWVWEMDRWDFGRAGPRAVRIVRIVRIGA